MPYQQTTTANPYGFRPWRTRLYTTFDDFSFLKQPQNTILRGDQTMRPEIYKPPEMKGLGDVLVTGSGRMLRGRRRSLRGLGVIINSDPFSPSYPVVPKLFSTMLPRVFGPTAPISSPIIVRGPISSGPVMPGPMPVAPLRFVDCNGYPSAFPGSCAPPPPPPPAILPPSIVPPPPTIVTSSPDGVVYSLPGAAGVPGSPFPPPSSSELPAPGSPVNASSTVSTGGSLADWFNSQTWIAGIPNGYVALGGAAALYLLARKQGRR